MLYLDNGIPVNSATFANEETWFELIGRLVEHSHRAGGIAEAAGTELCKGNVEEITDVEQDCTGTYPLAMRNDFRLSLAVLMWFYQLSKKIRKLTFRALALRRSESRNCGLCVVYIQKYEATLFKGAWQREK